jgi:hypothetical protein
MKLIDILLGLVIVALIITLVYAVTTKVPEPFTELYFENHTTLPKYSSSSSFIFSIHNHENTQMQYDVLIKIEGQNVSDAIEDFSISIPDGARRTFRVNYTLPSAFGTGRVIVMLQGTSQSIHFWTTQANRTTTYNGKLVTLDCVPEVPWSESMILKVHGTYEPRFTLLNNQEVIYNKTINGSRYLELHPQPGTLDLVFTNDFYNATTGMDRNLFLEYLKIDGLYYDQMMVDRGSGALAFDCSQTKMGNKLGGNGAMRVIIKEPEQLSIPITFSD